MVEVNINEKADVDLPKELLEAGAVGEGPAGLDKPVMPEVISGYVYVEIPITFVFNDPGNRPADVEIVALGKGALLRHSLCVFFPGLAPRASINHSFPFLREALCCAAISANKILSIARLESSGPR